MTSSPPITAHLQNLAAEVGHEGGEGRAAHKVHRVAGLAVPEILVFPQTEDLLRLQEIYAAALGHHRLDKVGIGKYFIVTIQEFRGEILI